MTRFDIAIIGGGINGTGIARDATGRGLKVLLVEMNDLASGTSSASSKLIHGGLRYLEHGAFRLVREALTEREVLLRMAPHAIRPMRFLLPPMQGLRAPLTLRFGLLLYDWLGARKLLPASRTVDLTHNMLGQPLQRQFRFGFEYSDCSVDDARLVVLNAVDARERGAVVRTRTKLVSAERGAEWDLVLDSNGRREAVPARVLINAAGPWIAELAETVIRQPLSNPVRLVKGSHIVVRRRFAHESGYILQAPGRRVVFALPFAQEFTLIGTTDENFAGNLSAPAPDAQEVRYLCDVMNTYFRGKVTPAEVVWSFSGVRPLLDDGASCPEDVTRDYKLIFERPDGRAPLLTVYGGKITTYRRLAEAALDKIAAHLTCGPAWTARSHLPGGDFPPDRFDEQISETMKRWPFLAEPHARRLTHAYGRRVERVLGDAVSMHDLGPLFTADLTGAEVRYLVEQEWAETADDVLWRRSKLGLIATPDERLALTRRIAELKGEPSVRSAPAAPAQG
jgi:glycerol-3-phosphate dehydrogenase